MCDLVWKYPVQKTFAAAKRQDPFSDVVRHAVGPRGLAGALQEILLGRIDVDLHAVVPLPKIGIPRVTDVIGDLIIINLRLAGN